MPFNAYVMLLRAWGCNNVCLLQDFKDDQFTSMPCEMLEREDKWILGMHVETRREWNESRGHWEAEHRIT